MTPKNLCVTGSSGFIGSALVDHLRLAGRNLVLPCRTVLHSGIASDEVMEVGRIDGATRWSHVLQGQDVVVHLAGLAHVMQPGPHALAEFREVNTKGTLNLASNAIAAGVKRFIFVSSIGVNGAHTSSSPFTEDSVPSPHADYAVSKLEAELGLWELVRGTDMELVIIRPPLVYAGHAPGNFKRLLALVASGVPLPFAAISNQRSMVALENLVDFITLGIDHPAAANQLFLISDGVEVSTADIVQFLAQGMGRQPRLFRMPSGWMQLAASLTGKQAISNQLCGSLQIDSYKARSLLAWVPPSTPAGALVKAGVDYKILRAAGK
ncbi:NAD-dependent epimerase/dehydratase family protein [Pseudomonas sp. UBA6310]|uniref:NAD-dependent epimerase/dehydratase family protein n=1 Tax=Pseudomonas sp. UBA6310 TaxID=1947327 RepID=UPI00257CC614|nr:NAD-dependent epimerase/dehydratase family protein [Pseudomonas sp. UBA6310]